MHGFSYQLGEIIVIDPTGECKGPKGKIIGQMLCIDGSNRYYVSCYDVHGNVNRYLLSGHEIHHPLKN